MVLPDVFFSSEESKPQLVPVMYDFIARNNKELTVRKGETVEVSFGNKLFPLFFLFLHVMNIISLLCWRTASGLIEAVVESEEQQGRGGLCAK